MQRVFNDKSVLEEARERVSLIFDNFKDVIVSVSSGKDSTVLYWLAIQEAEKRGRRVKAFFLDQEAEYQGSIDLIEKMMSHPNVEPLWYQVPINLTNTSSYGKEFLNAWEDGVVWVREKHPLAIHRVNGKYPKRFYSFFHWVERSHPGAAFLVGIRSEESLNRFRAVVSNPGWNGLLWSKKTSGKGTFKFYPIYDWGMGDVWRFISDYDLPYNAIYDKMLKANKHYHKTMRVSNLIHEKSFKCLKDLQMYEPETFNKLVKRLPGIHVASVYAGEKSVYDTQELPPKFQSWSAFRDYLLETTPLRNKQKFIKRFESQPDEEEMHRRQVRQLLLNDHENNLDGSYNKKEKRKQQLMEKWWDVL